MMKIVVVYNPKSGSALTRRELRTKCEAAKLKIEAFVEIGPSCRRKLSPLIKRGANVAAVGGDGTISAVAGMLVNTKAVLVPLPGGTLNHFAKDLGVPQDLDEALAALQTAKRQKIDVASVNGRYFINNSSMGVYPASLRSRDDIEHKIGKWPAAFVSAFQAIAQLKTYRVRLNGRTFRTPFLFVGNNRYSLDGLGVTERIALDKGLLTVFAAKTQSRFKLIKIAAFALFGSPKGLPEFDEFHAQSLTIKTKQPSLLVSYDGEVSRLEPPLNYRIHPKSLTILC